MSNQTKRFQISKHLKGKPTTNNQQPESKMRENCCSKLSWKLKTKTTWLLYFIFNVYWLAVYTLLITGNRWLQKLKAQFRQTTIAFICIYCLSILIPCNDTLHSRYRFSSLLENVPLRAKRQPDLERCKSIRARNECQKWKLREWEKKKKGKNNE